MDGKLKSLWIDMPSWQTCMVDDFIVAVSDLKSNSVYHVAKVERIVLRPHESGRVLRHHIKVYKSDLITCLRREQNQQLITMKWYKRG